MSAQSPTATNPSVKRLAAILGLLLLAAIAVRLISDSRRIPSAPPVPPLSMDDSSAVLPESPPPVPADNIETLRAAHAQVDRLASAAAPAAQEQRAEAALNCGDLWSADESARAVLKVLPNNRPARLSLAASLRRLAQFDAAEKIYRQLLREDSRDSDAYLGLADTTFAANRRPEAFKWLEVGANLGAQTPVSLSTIAHRYQDWTAFPLAEGVAVRAVQVAPGNIDSLLQLASIQVESGRLDAAYGTLETIFKKDSNNELAHRLMGVVLMNATYSHPDINRARSLLERAVELNARDIDIYSTAAVIYRQQRLYRLAAQAYDAMLHLDPTSLEGRYGLGQVYALLGKTDLSRKQLEMYKQLDDRHRKVIRLLEDVTHHPASSKEHAALARYLQSIGNYGTALPEYQTAATLDPRDTALRKEINRFYARLGWKSPESKLL